MVLGEGIMGGLSADVPDVDLAGDRGGDESDAAFLEEVDGALGFGGESFDLGGLRFDVDNDRSLFSNRWNDCGSFTDIFQTQALF